MKNMAESTSAGPSVPAWRGGFVDFLSKHFIGLAAILCLLIYVATYATNCFGPPIRADGVGYYSYLPAYVIYHDPSFERMAQEVFHGEIPTWTGIRIYPGTGRYMVKFNIGVALMMAPFFLAAHVMTHLFTFLSDALSLRLSCPADGFSFFYQHAAGLSGVFYMIAGLALLKRSLDQHFSPRISLMTCSSLLFGTNLLHYGSGESVLSHPYSFFLFAAIIVLLPGWFKKPDELRRVILVGVVAGLIVLVRTINVMFLVFIALYGVVRLRDVALRSKWFLQHWRGTLMVAAVALLVVLPQLIIWKYSSGRWIVDSYKTAYGERMEYLLHPRVLKTLFSLKAGVLFWSPILVFGIVGFTWLKNRVPEMFWPTLIYSLLNLYLIASWHDWAFGGGFHHRGFIESYTVMVFPMASFFERVAAWRIRVLRVGVMLLCVLMIAHTLFFMTLYYTREISYYGLDRQALFDIFWWRIHILKEWLLR